jgi:hypothetical protein
MYLSVIPLDPLPAPDIVIVPTPSLWEKVPGGVVEVCGSGRG